jgi:hypothetical protein
LANSSNGSEHAYTFAALALVEISAGLNGFAKSLQTCPLRLWRIAYRRIRLTVLIHFDPSRHQAPYRLTSVQFLEPICFVSSEWLYDINTFFFTVKILSDKINGLT